MATGQIQKPNNYFFREHLTNALAQIYRTPMTIITAPYGYGKEIAVSHYTLSSNARTLWLSIPKGAEKAYFWDAFRNILTGAEVEKAEFPALSADSLPHEHSEIGEFTDALRIAMTRQDIATVLIIDNVQNLPNLDAVFQFLTNISVSFVPNLHIVLLSTHYLPISAEDSLNGTMGRIGKALFCLDGEGVRQFFESYELELADGDVDHIMNFSEGWLSAVSALVITSLEHGGFSENHIYEAKRRLRRHLHDTVWMDLPEIARTFLSVTSVADSFTAEQAKYMCLFTGLNVEIDAMLKLLEGRHVLDVSHNGQYRMHGLLLSLARDEAKKLPYALCEKASRVLVEMNENGSLPESPGAFHLTAREWDVLPLLRVGKKYSEIASALYISENTVKTLTKSIYRKLGVSSKKELS